MSFRYLMYPRKSSESEERQELSIPAQIRELTELANRRELRIVGVPLEESYSAKAPGRPMFGKLMAELFAGRAEGILCWKLDRLARNPKDGGDIMWALSQGVIKEIVTPERTYTGTGDDKMLMSIMFGMATKYSDDLSVNVKRGNREALLSGRWPGYPKLGYVRDPETMLLVPDEERLPIIKNIFESVLSGVSPLTVYERAVREWKLTTPRHKRQGARPLVRSAFYRLLRDEFYTGVMIRGGERYPGTHPPALSVGSWQSLQELLDSRMHRHPRPKRLYFPYRGHVFCGTCGSLATARTVVNRWGTNYTYYHCYRKERRYRFCPEPAVSETVIENELGVFFDKIWLPPDWLEELLKLIEEQTKSAKGAITTEREKHEKELKRITEERARLRRLLVQEVFSQEDYEKDRAALDEEERNLRSTIEKLRTSKNYFQPLVDAGMLLNQAPYFFRDGTPEEKAQLVRDVTFSLKLTRKTALIIAKNSFHIFQNRSSYPSVRAWLDEVETWILANMRD